MKVTKEIVIERYMKVESVWRRLLSFFRLGSKRKWYCLYLFDKYGINGDLLAPGVIKKAAPLFPKIK